MLSPNISVTETLRNQGVCSQYLRSKVALYTAVRNTKRMSSLCTIKCLKLLAGCIAACLLLFTSAMHAAENMPQKKAPMPLDLIELLGELGDDEADLDAAMSTVESKRSEQKHTENKPPMTENSNEGATK